MEERNITITLDKAREWYNSENATLKEIALQAFNKDELVVYNFKNITTFQKACEVLGLNYGEMLHIKMTIATISEASAAMFKLNIIRKALNLGQDLHLTKDPKNSYIYYPYNPLVTKDSTCKSKLNVDGEEIIGNIKSEGKEYNILGGRVYTSGTTGLSSFYSHYSMGDTNANSGFLGCATEEIAKHFGKYFGMLITEAKYGDMVDFEIIESKY